jgi:hypothetical protein
MATTPHLTPVAPETPLRSVHTSTLPALFEQGQLSLVVSTYQAGKVIVVRNEGGVLNTHFRAFTKPMGLAADRTRLTIGGAHSVRDYRNMPAVAAKLEPPGTHNACYLPHRLHVTGDSTSTDWPMTSTRRSGSSIPASVACVRWMPSTASCRAGARRL